MTAPPDPERETSRQPERSASPYVDSPGVTVLVVDVDDTSRELMARHLRSAHYAVTEATDGTQALRKVFNLRPDAIVIDPNVPEMDGGQLIRILRAMTDIPIVVVAATRNPELTTRALDNGADDYLEKPFSGLELVARVRAAVRRTGRATGAQGANVVVRTGERVIDRDAYTVTMRGKLVRLTRTEYRLLEALASRVGEVAPHRFLLSTVWSDELVQDTKNLQVFIRRLRGKLEDDPSKPEYLISERGRGYRLEAMSAVEEAPERVLVRTAANAQATPRTGRPPRFAPLRGANGA